MHSKQYIFGADGGNFIFEIRICYYISIFSCWWFLFYYYYFAILLIRSNIPYTPEFNENIIVFIIPINIYDYLSSTFYHSLLFVRSAMHLSVECSNRFCLTVIFLARSRPDSRIYSPVSTRPVKRETCLVFSYIAPMRVQKRILFCTRQIFAIGPSNPELYYITVIDGTTVWTNLDPSPG